MQHDESDRGTYDRHNCRCSIPYSIFWTIASTWRDTEQDCPSGTVCSSYFQSRTYCSSRLAAQLPWWALVSFGSYSLGYLGWHVMTFSDCPEAYTELMNVNAIVMPVSFGGIESANLKLYAGNRPSQNRLAVKRCIHLITINNSYPSCPCSNIAARYFWESMVCCKSFSIWAAALYYLVLDDDRCRLEFMDAEAGTSYDVKCINDNYRMLQWKHRG